MALLYIWDEAADATTIISFSIPCEMSAITNLPCDILAQTPAFPGIGGRLRVTLWVEEKVEFVDDYYNQYT